MNTDNVPEDRYICPLHAQMIAAYDLSFKAADSAIEQPEDKGDLHRRIGHLEDAIKFMMIGDFYRRLLMNDVTQMQPDFVNNPLYRTLEGEFKEKVEV